MLPDAQITRPHFAQSAIEISEHAVEKTLTDTHCRRSLGLQSMEVEECVQADQLKAPIERVGHAILGKKNRLPSLFHYASIRDIGSITDKIASGQ